MPSEFWDMTYAEFCLVAEGFVKRMERSHDERMHLAWHTAALTRYREDFPPLADLLLSGKTEPQVQTEDEMIARLRLITAALGGEVVESGT